VLCCRNCGVTVHADCYGAGQKEPLETGGAWLCALCALCATEDPTGSRGLRLALLECAICGRSNASLSMKPFDRVPTEDEERILRGERGTADEPPTKRAWSERLPPGQPPFCHCFCVRCLPSAKYDGHESVFGLSEILRCIERVPHTARPCAYCGESIGTRIKCAAPGTCETLFHPSCSLLAGGGLLVRLYDKYSVVYPVCHEHTHSNFAAEDAHVGTEDLDAWLTVLATYEGLARHFRPFWLGATGRTVSEAQKRPLTTGFTRLADFEAGSPRFLGHAFLGTLGDEYVCQEHCKASVPFRFVTESESTVQCTTLTLLERFHLDLARLRSGAWLQGVMSPYGCDCVYSRAAVLADSRLYRAPNDRVEGSCGTLSFHIPALNRLIRIHYVMTRVYAMLYGLLERTASGGAPVAVQPLGRPGCPSPPTGTPVSLQVATLCAPLRETLDADLLPRLSFVRLRICPGVARLARLEVPLADLLPALPLLSAAPHASWNEAIGLAFVVLNTRSAHALHCLLVLESELSRPLWPAGQRESERQDDAKAPVSEAPQTRALILYICKFPQAIPRALLSIP